MDREVNFSEPGFNPEENLDRNSSLNPDENWDSNKEEKTKQMTDKTKGGEVDLEKNAEISTEEIEQNAETEREQAIKEQQELDNWRDLKNEGLLTEETENVLDELEEIILKMNEIAKVLGTIELGKEEELKKEKEKEFKELESNYKLLRERLRELDKEEKLVKENKEEVEKSVEEKINDDVVIKVDKKPKKKGILGSLFGKK